MIISGYIYEKSDNNLYISKKNNNINHEEILGIQLSSFDKKFVRVKYSISDVPFDKINNNLFVSYFGNCCIDPQYSIYSDDSKLIHNCIIGLHNLSDDLSYYHGLYIVLEIEEVDKPRWIK